MQGNLLQALLAVCFLAFSSPTFAIGDPCDFASTGPIYSHTQVLSCYQSVPFNPSDLQNSIDVIGAYRERSSLREIYEQRVGWRASLEALGTATFPNDYALQVALVLNHKEFDNGHIRYQRPWCYVGMVTAFVPFEFGSTVVDGIGQIIFVEAAPYLAAEYQAATGIDTTQFIGQRVVSINGVDTLDYFRQFGRSYQRQDANDGFNLSDVLTTSAYSLRLDTRHDLTPPNAVDSYVFATPDGTTTSVDIPWMFAPRTAFSWGDPLTSTTAEFVANCLVPGPGAPAARQPNTSVLLEKLKTSGPVYVDPGRDEKSKAVSRKMKQSSLRSTTNGFFEVPPDQLGQYVNELVPWTNSARVLTLPDDNTTVIRLADFVGDWQVPVRAATEYACANSSRLILDLRDNGGGQPTHTTWLVRHLLPDAVSPAESRNVSSFLNEPGMQELALRSSIAAANLFGEFSCWFAFEAACHNDAMTGQQMSNLIDQDWPLDQLRLEDRAGVMEPLTRKIWRNEAFNNGWNFDFTGYDPISCPGKFEDNSLIVLTNGLSFSAGYFFTELIRDRSTIITAGGYVDEPLVSGVDRGGSIFPQRNVSDLEQYLAYRMDPPFGAPVDPLPEFSRDVNTYAEMGGAIYRANGVDLHVDNVPYGDIQIPVWSDSPETDGYVYRAVLAALADLTVTSSVDGPGGDITPSGDQQVGWSQTAEFILAPASGYMVDDVTGSCDGALNGLIYTTDPVTENCTVVVAFKLKPELIFESGFETSPN